MSTTTVFAANANSSHQKQLVYTKYAQGELSLAEATEAIAAIVPPERRLPAGYGIAKVLAVVLSAMILPTWATRRSDDNR